MEGDTVEVAEAGVQRKGRHRPHCDLKNQTAKHDGFPPYTSVENGIIASEVLVLNSKIPHNCYEISAHEYLPDD
jgi:hypothetical protein